MTQTLRTLLRGLGARVLLVALGATLLAALGTTLRAGAQTPAKPAFDHLGTGFGLTGAHTNTRCEACHVNGVFKGTPRDCAACHREGNRLARGNVVMPAGHLPTQQACDACHRTQSFAAARFNHAGVSAGSCQTCHNGSTTSGKPATHVPTSASCDSCHRTVGWLPASGFDHAGVTPGSCATCHNGSRATGKNPTHVPTGAAACDACHRAGGAWRPTSWNHTQVVVAAQCATCHTGGFPPADGRSANHIPYQSVAVTASANCDTCHKGSTTTWANGRLHANASISTGCASCHTGAYQAAVGKPATATHSAVTGNCESCHKSASNWSSAKVDHSIYNAATNCTTCHNGSNATGKSATHMPIGTTGCFACHSAGGSWTPTSWNHTQVVVAAQCATCHTGGFPPADGRSANHIPYQSVAVTAAANCDACHKGSTTTWANGRLHANASISTGCASCHTGAYQAAVGKPATATHSAVTGNCESCHKSTTNWSSATVDHSIYNAATNCTTCHNGTNATGKSATHIPIGTTGCFACHNAGGSWTPTKWNHTQVTVAAQCATCHTGGFPPADGRTANHIPYQSVPVTAAANCDTCHKGSTTTWANGRLHANASISTGCASCHTGAYQAAVGKPATATHSAVTGNCESCHKSTTNWSSAKVDHSIYNAATNCTTCHNGTNATGKSATHIPIGTTGCFACHNAGGSWTPTKWNHTQVAVTAQCASCHTGSYPPADGRPTNHIPYQTVPVTAAANCDACHKGSTTTWANGRLHANATISTGCASCHTGAYLAAVGKPATATHATVTGNCESCHRSTASWTSGVVFAHSAANAVGTGTCDTCHTGVQALGKPTTHVPIPAGAAKCDSCHRSQASFATAVTMNHSVVTTGQCKSCHNGSYTSQGATGALAKPANHIPELQLLAGATMDCVACHTTGTTSWSSPRMNHNGSQGNGAGWCKGCHDRATAYLGSMEKKALTHQKSTGVTDCSQSGCHRPLGTKGAAYTKWD